MTARRAALALLACALAGCQSVPVLQPFATDGCSMFPDHAPIGKADWCACCVAHDLAYWRGGTEAERLEADRALETCVTAASGSPALAQTMYAGVRAGGVPYFLTSYRWGYGWPYGRMYRSLGREEAAQADALRAHYLAANPFLVCTADTTASSSSE
nr:hypothetical protein [uncultured Massilia sp.]